MRIAMSSAACINKDESRVGVGYVCPTETSAISFYNQLEIDAFKANKIPFAG